eukprot:ANDGO_03257.mRNA.1 hypothetical protein
MSLKRPRLEEDSENVQDAYSNGAVTRVVSSTTMLRVPPVEGILILQPHTASYYRPIDEKSTLLFNVSQFQKIVLEPNIRIDVGDEKGNWAYAMFGSRISFCLFSVASRDWVLAESIAFAPSAFHIYRNLVDQLS